MAGLPGRESPLLERGIDDSVDRQDLFNLLRFFASPGRLEEIRNLYLFGGAAYGTLKKELAELILNHFSQPRKRFDELINDKAYLDQVLLEGAAKARAMGQPYLAAARKATGID